MATDVAAGGLGHIGLPPPQDASRPGHDALGLAVLGFDAGRAVVEGPGVHRL